MIYSTIRFIIEKFNYYLLFATYMGLFEYFYIISSLLIKY